MTFEYPDWLVWREISMTHGFSRNAVEVNMDGGEFIEKLQHNIINEIDHPIESIIHSITYYVRNQQSKYLVLNVRMTYSDYCRLSMMMNGYNFDMFDDLVMFVSRRNIYINYEQKKEDLEKVNMILDWKSDYDVDKAFIHYSMSLDECIRFIPADEESMLKVVKNKLSKSKHSGGRALKSCTKWGFKYLHPDVRRWLLENDYDF